MNPNLFHFQFPGHATAREWSIYVIAAKPISSPEVFYYVGKVGDNRDGCNPVISRIGNHFSFNKIHSQMRNKLKEYGHVPIACNFTVHAATFGAYASENRNTDRINELERRLNKIMQEKLLQMSPDHRLLNPYIGKHYLPKAEKELRNGLLVEEDILILEQLAEQVLK